LVLAAAKRAGCVELLTEDFNDGQDYDGVRALNPFRTTAIP
jgi:predicted nucleic acid-binding protein